MSETPDTPPESNRFDEFVEIAVDGKPIFRLEQRSELELSDVDDAVIAFFANEIGGDVDEELQEKYDKGAEGIIRDEQPDVQMYETESEEWERLQDM